MEDSILHDLTLNFSDLKFAIVSASIALILFLIAKYIFKVSERLKYDLSLLSILFCIIAFLFLVPLVYILMKIGLWILLLGIVLYIGYILISNFTK